MIYRNLGETDLTLSAITFGAWAIGGWMWGGNDDNDAKQAIKAAFDHGITSIDTAPIYGFGHSESLVGEVLKDLPRDQVQLCTKFGLRWDLAKGTLMSKTKDDQGKDLSIYKYGGKESIIEECEHSLKRLGTDYIDLYQIHWPDDSTPIQESFEAVAKLKEQGKIREAGVCNYSLDQFKEADKATYITSDQVPFSMILREYEEELVPWTRENNRAILAYSPLQRGLLTGKYDPKPNLKKGDHRKGNKFFKENNIRQVNAFLEKIKPIAEEKEASLAQLVLAWTINRPGITIALAGARNAEQVIDNAKAAEISLDQEELIKINKALEGVEIS